MEGHLTMSKKERARLVVMAKITKSEMKISEALRCGSRDVATVADPGGIIGIEILGAHSPQTKAVRRLRAV